MFLIVGISHFIIMMLIFGAYESLRDPAISHFSVALMKVIAPVSAVFGWGDGYLFPVLLVLNSVFYGAIATIGYRLMGKP